MVSVDLSQHLEMHSKKQTNWERQGAPHSSNSTALRQKRLNALKLSRVKRESGIGHEMVPCLSFRQASSLAIVLFLLSNILMDVTVLCVMFGSAVSTVSLARELRHETLEQRRLRESMYESSIQLRLAMRELQMAEAEWSRMPLSTFRFDLEEDIPESC